MKIKHVELLHGNVHEVVCDMNCLMLLLVVYISFDWKSAYLSVVQLTFVCTCRIVSHTFCFIASKTLSLSLDGYSRLWIYLLNFYSNKQLSIYVHNLLMVSWLITYFFPSLIMKTSWLSLLLELHWNFHIFMYDYVWKMPNVFWEFSRGLQQIFLLYTFWLY